MPMPRTTIQQTVVYERQTNNHLK